MYSSVFTSPQIGMRIISILISLKHRIVSIILFYDHVIFIALLICFYIFADLINFSIPRGFDVTVSSQSTNNSFTSYTLSDLGVVSGSISYLYSSKPLANVKTSKEILLKDAIAGYKFLEPLKRQEDPMYWEVWQNGIRVDTRGKNMNIHN